METPLKPATSLKRHPTAPHSVCPECGRIFDYTPMKTTCPRDGATVHSFNVRKPKPEITRSLGK